MSRKPRIVRDAYVALRILAAERIVRKYAAEVTAHVAGTGDRPIRVPPRGYRG